KRHLICSFPRHDSQIALTIGQARRSEAMATPLWILKTLQGRGIPIKEMHHREAFTAQELAQREHFTGHRVAKVVVVMADGGPVELILPASRHVDLDRVRTLLHAHDLRLATEAE